MDKFSTELIAQLEDALRYPDRQRALLQQQETLREIMNHIPARQWLFEQARQTQVCAQAEKARLLIIRIVLSPAFIWHGGDSGLSPEVYEEALARTLEWFSGNLERYVPERASFVTWFNNKLKWTIADVRAEMDKDQQLKEPPHRSENGELLDPLDNIPTPNPDYWQETIQSWLILIQSDLILRNCRMQNAPNINGQNVLTHILQMLRESGEFSWDAIAQTYNIEPSALRRFCRTRCFPRFKQLWSK
jgi:hypothetical protein